MIQELSFPDVLMPTPEEVFVNENRIKLVYTSAALAYFLRETELTNHKIDNLEKYLKFRGMYSFIQYKCKISILCILINPRMNNRRKHLYNI